MYLKNLHMFKESSWASVGLKPKAKDLKSVIEDLSQMEYLQNIEDYQTNIVLDGRKVRIGFESQKLDYLYNKHYETEQALIQLGEVEGDNKPPAQAIFDINIVLNQKLDQMLSSEDPLIYEIFRGLNLQASVKFHSKQFKQILKATKKKEEGEEGDDKNEDEDNEE